MYRAAKNYVAGLQAALIVATPAAATATATAAATATTASAEAAASTAATSAAPTTAAFALWTGFVDNDLPAHQVLAIERLDGPVGLFIIVDLNEPEPARLTGEAVADQSYVRRSDARLNKPVGQLFLIDLKRQIPDIQLFHRRTPSAR